MIQVDVEKFLQELELLVNMDSGFGNAEGITAVGKYLADRLAAKGWITEQIDVGTQTGKCTVVKNRQSEHYDVMLVGHVDTVFPMGETAKRPFRRDEHRAYGLGTLDMKQGDLAIVHILEQLPAEVNEKLNILAIFNPDEEIGSIYSAPLIDAYAQKTDYAYVFEATSTDGYHAIQRKGKYCARITFHGKAGHAGYLFDGGMVSAINELLYWGNMLNGLLSAERGTSVNIGVIQGGVKPNIVPDLAEMIFEARYECLEEHEKLRKLLEQLKEHAQMAGVTVEVSDVRETPPMIPTDRTLAYVRRVEALARSHGLPFKLKKRGGISDANHISACGTICIDGMAPTGNFAHSDKEYLEIATVEPNLQLAYLMLCDLAELKSDTEANGILLKQKNEQ